MLVTNRISRAGFYLANTCRNEGCLPLRACGRNALDFDRTGTDSCDSGDITTTAAVVRKHTSRGLGRQGLVLKHRNRLQKGPVPFTRAALSHGHAERW